eukprot:1161983-Pelagomonas_calceolata.AAC.1
MAAACGILGLTGTWAWLGGGCCWGSRGALGLRQEFLGRRVQSLGQGTRLGWVMGVVVDAWLRLAQGKECAVL